MIYKLPPFAPLTDRFDPQNSLCEEDIKNLRDWGFNFVRLGVLWPGVEPVRGKYNYTYLEVMKNLTINLGKQGIYVLIDVILKSRSFLENFLT